ncbi:cytidine deaminase [Maribacter hydrothermalis]|uniref:Cytidine deaminase n=1 Tax=Maribacter hydrothermalis TaxID=1836467 RepID=A0A1B7ZDK3_9FLAO|nr:cytidine deaminase [Maribacter hydrothermalis]APQ16667.1 cytidine deaminase [Maribacter hydrothermalis]OBR41429.1 cytidine deaminase [Maribacter hydrothermalis]
MPIQKNISFNITIYNAIEELSDNDKMLMSAAVQARKKAYAPYSDFFVGAAVLLENGEIVEGNNQENASYPSGLCAERVAVFYAGAKYPGMGIKAIAISASSLNHVVSEPVAPCGNCRQSISEYEFRQKKPIRILLMGETGSVIECKSLGDLLPLGFNSSYLK